MKIVNKKWQANECKQSKWQSWNAYKKKSVDGEERGERGGVWWSNGVK